MASGTFSNLLSDVRSSFQSIPGGPMPFSPVFCRSKYTETQSYQMAGDTSKGGTADQSVWRLVSLRKGGSGMHLKGFILEDSQGREFVMVCERSHVQLRKIFALRGWQRRRLVPMHHTERELRKIVGGVVIELNDLFDIFPRRLEQADKALSNKKLSFTLPALHVRKAAK